MLEGVDVGLSTTNIRSSLVTLDNEIKLQFNADVNNSINWLFKAPQDVSFKIGENKLVDEKKN